MSNCGREDVSSALAFLWWRREGSLPSLTTRTLHAVVAGMPKRWKRPPGRPGYTLGQKQLKTMLGVIHTGRRQKYSKNRLTALSAFVRIGPYPLSPPCGHHSWMTSFSTAHWSRIGADESTRQIWLADDMVETATHQRGACTPPPTIIMMMMRRRRMVMMIPWFCSQSCALWRSTQCTSSDFSF